MRVRGTFRIQLSIQPFVKLTCEHLRLNGGTDVIAPPGAHTVTPRSPSMVGPRLDHVYGVPGSFSRVEYSATIISGETYAPTPGKGKC